MLVGHHHQWRPGIHTLLLAGWLNADLRVSDPFQGTLLIGRDPANAITDVLPLTIEQRYRNEATIASAINA